MSEPDEHTIKKHWVRINDTDTMKPSIKCKKGGDTCHVVHFAEAVRLTPFHDENLQQCTNELNEIVRKYASKLKDPKCQLACLETSEGLFLAWVDCAEEEEEDKIAMKHLGII